MPETLATFAVPALADGAAAHIEIAFIGSPFTILKEIRGKVEAPTRGASTMFRHVATEAAALAAVTLFVGTVVLWAAIAEKLLR